MDTVTEYEMAVGMARNGGLGIIHRFLSVDDQANMVARVKQTESHIIENPITVGGECLISEIKQIQEQYDIKTILITNQQSNYNK